MANRRVRWSARGCVLALVLVVGLGVYGGWGPFKGLANCVPSDFPHYGGSLWGGSSGSGSSCRETRLALEASSGIIDFYTSQLRDSSWTVTAIDRQSPVIDVTHANGASISGAVWVVNQGPFRVICLDFESPASARGGGLELQTESIVTRTSNGTACSGSIPQPATPPV